jgi:hypothetical protein
MVRRRNISPSLSKLLLQHRRNTLLPRLISPIREVTLHVSIPSQPQINLESLVEVYTLAVESQESVSEAIRHLLLF